MSVIFRERSRTLERLDKETFDPATTAEIFQALEATNRWLGGFRATLRCLSGFSCRWPAGAKLRFLDWGTGGADIPRAIVRWCRSRGFSAAVVAVDNTPATLSYARLACMEYPEIQVVQGDLEQYQPDGVFDYVMSSLTLHHLSDIQIIRLLEKSDRLAVRGLIMNDLKRSARAWAWIWSLGHLLRAPAVFQADGPLSVRRAFTRAELQGLAVKAGLPYLKVQTHFGYRFTLAGEK